jgi:ribose transport system permease protein
MDKRDAQAIADREAQLQRAETLPDGGLNDRRPGHFDRVTTRGLAQKYAILVVFGALFIALASLSSSFLKSTNLINILSQSSELGIIACAETLLIIGGDFDLSTGAVFGLVSVTSAGLAAHGLPVLGIATAPVIGLLCGSLNGGIATWFGVNSFLVTLASSLIFSGIAVLLSQGYLIPVTSSLFTTVAQGSLGPIPNPVLVFIGFAVIGTFLLRYTGIGQHILAVGGSAEAARRAGIPVERVRILTFALSGFAAAVAGLLGTSLVASGDPNSGTSYTLNAIAAVILGGTSLAGGRGAIWRSVIGVLLITLIGNGFDILNASPLWQTPTTGIIIMLAVALGGTRNGAIFRHLRLRPNVPASATMEGNS